MTQIVPHRPAALKGMEYQPPDQQTYDEWERDGKLLRTMHHNLPWLLGDWLNYGQAAFGEKYSQALDQWDFEIDTLYHYSMVAAGFPAARRRTSTSSTGFQLTWTHYRRLLSMAEIDQEVWLGRAFRESLSVRELDQAIRAQLGSGKKAGDPDPLPTSQQVVLAALNSLPEKTAQLCASHGGEWETNVRVSVPTGFASITYKVGVSYEVTQSDPPE
tara:strand:- start:211 stop:858 length:648 start_codon:yes stop_codon:yes gene_type:complete